MPARIPNLRCLQRLQRELQRTLHLRRELETPQSQSLANQTHKAKQSHPLFSAWAEWPSLALLWPVLPTAPPPSVLYYDLSPGKYIFVRFAKEGHTIFWIVGEGPNIFKAWQVLKSENLTCSHLAAEACEALRRAFEHPVHRCTSSESRTCETQALTSIMFLGPWQPWWEPCVGALWVPRGNLLCGTKCVTMCDFQKRNPVLVQLGSKLGCNLCPLLIRFRSALDPFWMKTENPDQK